MNGRRNIQRVLVVATLLLVLGAASACSSGEASDPPGALPELVGKRLDVAKADLKDLGLDGKHVEVVGGGTFGVVVDSNWTVCQQDPAAGVEAGSVRLVVDRECTTNPTGTPPTTTPAPPAAAPVMPKIDCGTRLDYADRQLKAAGINSSFEEDLTGQDRGAYDYGNWRVLTQSPMPGTPVTNEEDVRLGVVKNDEYIYGGYDC